jgi:hypothetical protein
MKNLTRIVTFMGYPNYGTPQQMLENGSVVLTLPDKVRLFAVRRVSYDDGMTPLYATPYPYEKTHKSLKELISLNKAYILLRDAPILDVDNNLKVYDHDEVWN